MVFENQEVAKAKILVVDDDLITATSIKKSLESYGFNIIGTAANSVEAIKLVISGHPDLVIMDINLRGSKDGIETSKEIQEIADLPIIFITAYSDDEIIQRAKKIAVYGYLIKPFDNRELYSNIEMALYKHSMEKRLKASEESLSITLRSIGDAVISTDINGNVVQMNPMAEKLCGWSISESVGKPLSEIFIIVNSETRTQVDNPVKLVIESGEIMGLANHTLLISKDGTEYQIADSAAPIKNKVGEIQGVVLVFSDVTEKYSIENALSKSEEKFRKAFYISPDSIAINRLSDGLYVSINLGFTKILGYTESEIIGKSSIEFNIWENINDRNKLIKELLRSGIVENMEAKFIGKGGQLRYGLMSASIIELNGEKHILSITRDITARKQVEEKLRESEKEYRDLFELANDSIIIFEPENELVLDVNSKACETYGYLKEEFVGMSLKNISEDIVAGEQKIEQILNSIRFDNFETKHIKKDGSILNLLVSASVITYKGVKAIQSINLDITNIINAENKLKESEERYKNFISQLSEGVYRFELNVPMDINLPVEEQIDYLAYNMFIAECNPSFLEMYGAEEMNDIIGKKQIDLYGGTINDVNRDALRHFIVAGYKAENKITEEYDVNKKLKYFSNNAVGIIKDNHFIRMWGTQTDITEKRKAEKALKKSENELKSIVNAGNVFIIKTDLLGNYTFCNRKFVDNFGWIFAGKDIIGSNSMDSICPEDHAKTVDVVTKCINNPEIPFEAEIKKPLHTGKQLISLWQFTCLLDLLGNPSEILCVGIDITKRKKAELEIRKLSNVVQQSPTSVIITDIDGNIEFTNDHFTEVTGYTFSEVVGENPSFLKTDYFSDEVDRVIWETILVGNTWRGEFQSKKKNGELFWEDAIIAPIKDEVGTIINYFILKTDITKRKETEKELEVHRNNLASLVEERTEELDVLNKELLSQLQKGKILETQLAESLSKEKEINELKTRFIATVSHEFRTPLAALFSSSQMIQRYSKKWSEEKLNKHYDSIEATVKYLTQLLDDVLTTSRADREILTNNPELVDVEDFFQSILEKLQPELMEFHNLVFNNELDKSTIAIDKKLLTHIILNLLTNSIKYSPTGGDVKLNISSEEKNLKIVVSDSGLGIPEDEIKYIFDAFYRSQNTAGINGSGLGLNMVKRVIDVLNGKIFVESKLNEGTTFTVKLPLYK